ncbi:MAG: glycosyltransferase family 39 protein [Scytolyngbya sp. HA4215-MV1]|jgi:4-amino-4-deoxy-L-arabinose transferase-like glycosyltransferase|nr:glycosyltransferase family 39 protein [Scytolyngbya sp. HA4215-MV1]
MGRLLKIGQKPTVFRMLSILWVLLVGGLAFFWQLGNTGLIDETEPLFAEAARQMTVTGDWITPYFNEQTRFDKPPLIYWLMAISYQILGVNEWSARLPSALAGLLLTGLCFYVLWWVGDRGEEGCRERGTRGRGDREVEREGEGEVSQSNIAQPKSKIFPSSLTPFLGSAIAALNPYMLFFGRTGYSDMLLNFCLGGALLSFFLGYAQPERRSVQVRWYLALYVFIALAVLTKGPIGIVLPGLIIALFLAYLGKFRQVSRELLLLPGLLLVVVISLPWYVLVTWRNGSTYLNAFFGFHNIERFTQVVNDHAGPWFYHWVVILLAFLPWSLFLPGAIVRFLPRSRAYWQEQPRPTHLPVFAWFWFFSVLSFFTIASTKYFSYVLPSVAAAAILIALWWRDTIVRLPGTQPIVRSLTASSVLSLAGTVTLAIVCYYCPHWLDNDSSMPNLGDRIQQAGLPMIGAVIWGTGAIAGAGLWLSRRRPWLLVTHFVSFVIFLGFVLIPVTHIIDVERQLPLRQIAQTVVQSERPNEAVIMVDDGFDKHSLVFYTRQSIRYLDRPRNTIAYLQQWFQQKPTAQSVLVILSPRILQKSKLSPGQYQVIRQDGIYQLIRVAREGVL